MKKIIAVLGCLSVYLGIMMLVQLQDDVRAPVLFEEMSAKIFFDNQSSTQWYNERKGPKAYVSATKNTPPPPPPPPVTRHSH